MSAAKKLGLVAAGLLTLLLATIVAGLFTVRSQWFRDQVRNRIASGLEEATGGRVEIGGFEYDWRTVTAEVDNLVLHGKETPSETPFLRASQVKVGLHILSFVDRKFDIASLAVEKPQVHIVVLPDGATNVPTPRVMRRSYAVERLLDLKIGRLTLHDGVVEYNSERIPLNIAGQQVTANLRYERAGPRYAGELSAQRIEASAPGLGETVSFGFNARGAIEKDRISMESARFSMRQSTIEMSGAIESLSAPRLQFGIEASIVPQELDKALRLPVSSREPVKFSGVGTFDSASHSYDLRGRLTGRELRYAKAPAEVEHVAFASNIAVGPRRVELSNLTVNAMGGAFQGSASVTDWKHFVVDGEVRDISIEQLAAARGERDNPLSGSVSGPLHVSGSLGKSGVAGVLADAAIDLHPGAGGVPLQGILDVHYDQQSGNLQLGNSHMTLGKSAMSLSGTLGETLAVHVTSRDFDDFLAVFPVIGEERPRVLPIALKGGEAKFDGTIVGPFANPRITGQLEITRFEYHKRDFDRLTAHVDVTPTRLDARAVTLARGTLQAQGEARIGLTDWKPTDRGELSVNAAIHGATVQQLIAETGTKAKIDVNGAASVTIQLKGELGAPEIGGVIQATNVVAYGEQAGSVRVDANYKNGEIDVSRGDIAIGSARVTATGSYRHVKDDWKSGEVRFNVNGGGIALTQLKVVQSFREGLRGSASVQARGSVKFEKGEANVESLDGQAELHSIVLDGRPYGSLQARAATNGGLLNIDAGADLRGSKIQGQGAWRLSGDYPGHGRIEIPRLTVATLHDLAPGEHVREQLPFDGYVEGAVSIEGPLKKPDAMTARVTLSALQVSASPNAHPPPGEQVRDLVLRNSEPVVLEATTKSIDIRSAHFVAKDTTLDARGRLALDSKDPWDLDLAGNINLAILQIFNPDLLGAGASIVRATVRGSLNDPQVDGRMELKEASLFLKDLPNGIDQANGVILFDRNRATVQSLTAVTGGGRVTFQSGSFVGFRGQTVSYRLQASADNVRYRSADGISVTLSAALTLVGSSAQSVLAGTVTVVRAGFNPRTDVGGLLASTARPVAIATTPNDYLRGIQFDVRILSAPTLEVQTSLTRNIQAEADLRLRGTPEKPVVLGNVTVTAGEIEFFGNKYSINRGSLNFYNPTKIEPIIDMDLDTRVRGITVDIRFAGSLNKLNFSYRSDPPLETNQILALLAVGRAPTAQNGLATSQTTTNTSFMATGTNDLLSQAISPENGRLQRLFGVSHIKLDPQYTELTSIPQARVTFEQQVSKDITLTYITNLTRAAEQIVRVEWDLSRRWSVVALRDENGAFGIDFQYRKSFK